MKNFERVIDIIVGIIIMFFVPLIYFSQGHDRLLQEMIKVKTSNFTDLIETQGYISTNMYEGFLKELSTADVLLEVSIEHQELVYEPEYRLRSVDEVIEDQDRSYTGENFYTYRPVQTEIPIVYDPIDTSGLNTETNESVLAGAVNQLASSTHIHSDACYHGAEKHVHQGNSSNGGDCYTQGSGSVCMSTWSLVSSEPFVYGTENCWNCGVSQTTYSTRYHLSCGNGHTTSTNGFYHYSCSNCGVGYSRDAGAGNISGNLCYRSTVTYILSCGKEEGKYYMDDREVSSVCHLLIESITPTHPIQKVQQGSSIITTVNLTYKDGSTKVVVCSHSFSTNTVVQNDIATLRYFYTIWDVNYEKTCNITITVIPKNKTCGNGHTYNLKADGGDPGCPYCKAWIQSIVLAYPSSGNLTIYKGKTLQESGVGLLATYMDGRTEYVYTEYIDNLDRNYVGTQTVTIGYKGKTLTLTVTTKRNLVQCSVCHRNYELYPDGTNLGCPYCQSNTPIFTGNVLTYYEKDTENDILSKLYEGEGKYYFREGDYISICVQNKAETIGMKVLGVTIPRISPISVRIVQGGVIRDGT